MRDDHLSPIAAPDEDPDLARALALPQLAPRGGLADRILDNVWVPLPPWAVSLRDRADGLTSGPRGWAALASLSLSTAALWTILASVAVAQWNVISEVAGYVGSEFLAPAWTDGVARGTAEIEAFQQTALGAAAVTGLSVEFLAGAYAVVALISLLALRRLAAHPIRSRNFDHVAH